MLVILTIYLLFNCDIIMDVQAYVVKSQQAFMTELHRSQLRNRLLFYYADYISKLRGNASLKVSILT